MNELSAYLIDQCRKIQDKEKINKKNRHNLLEMHNFFKNSEKIEINGRFVRACRYVLPVPTFLPIKNNMSKYKLKRK